MDRRLKGKRVLITGASRGIGRAIALNLAEQGCTLALLARSESGLKETASFCDRAAAVAAMLPFDLRNIGDIPHVVDAACSALGGLDILVNNAGISAGATLGGGDIGRINDVIAINLSALINLTYYAIPKLKLNRWGAIINIASIAGKQATGSGAVYCASKHGVVGFSAALFDELREDNIKVCAICPGYVHTDMVDSANVDTRKMIQPEDIAAAALYVLKASPEVCPTEIIVRPQRSPYRRHS